MVTVNQSITLDSSKTASSTASVSVSKTANNTITFGPTYNKKATKKRITANIPVIFHTKTDGKEVVFTSRPDTKPVIFYLRLAINAFYHTFVIRISQLISTIQNNLITVYVFAKQAYQTITMNNTSAVPTSSSITISKTSSTTTSNLTTTENQDTEPKTGTFTNPVNSSSAVTVSDTSSQTSTITTSYTTVVA